MSAIDRNRDHDHIDSVMRFAMETMILLLSPLVPHFAEELWSELAHKQSVLLAPWPTYRDDALEKDEWLIVVQVNGKLRSRFTVAAEEDEEKIKQTALSDDKILKFINGKTVKKIIVVKNKLVNIVV